MSNQIYEMYLEELKGISPCLSEETAALLQRLPQEDAVKRLAEGSLSYIVSMAEGFAKAGVEISDLIQEGNMALLLLLKHYGDYSQTAETEQETPAERFERQREVAVRTAMQLLADRQTESDKTSEKLAASINVLNVVTTKLAQELGRQATLSEIAKKMQMSEDEVQILMKTAISAVNIDRTEAAEKAEASVETEDGSLPDFY